MDRRHPETELIAYLKDELPAAAREDVARHLEGCAACRDMLASEHQRTPLDCECTRLQIVAAKPFGGIDGLRR